MACLWNASFVVVALLQRLGHSRSHVGRDVDAPNRVLEEFRQALFADVVLTSSNPR